MEAQWHQLADDLGPEKVILITEPACGLRAVLVVDNTAAGPAIGGIRMAPDVTVDEVFRLARAMTFKNAAAGLRHGGGKPGSSATRTCRSPTRNASFELLVWRYATSSTTYPGPTWASTRRAWHTCTTRSAG